MIVELCCSCDDMMTINSPTFDQLSRSHQAVMIQKKLHRLTHRTIPFSTCGLGQPLLLLHGYPLDNRLWSSVMPLLAGSFFCIAPDFRGFGESSEETKSFSIADLADDCDSLLQGLGIRNQVFVCGLSMGGYVAMELIERHPALCSMAILTNTRCNSDEPAAALHRRSVANIALRDGAAEAVLPMLPKLLSQDTFTNSPVTVGVVKEMMTSTKASTIAWAQLAMTHRADFSSRMKSWTIPVVCIGGRDDTICPPTSLEQMSMAIPKATTFLVDNTAHLTPLEAPRTFASICQQAQRKTDGL